MSDSQSMERLHFEQTRLWPPSSARCRLMNPTYVNVVADEERKRIRVHASVICHVDILNTSKPIEVAYNSIGALVTFTLAAGNDTWVPTSFLAQRIWMAQPGHWGDFDLPVERQTFNVAQVAAAMAPKGSGFAWPDVAKVIEIRNSDHPPANDVSAMNAFETATMLLNIQRATDGKLTPKNIEGFLRHAGISGTKLSDDGIIHFVPSMLDPD